jgi:hypothetical protein
MSQRPSKKRRRLFSAALLLVIAALVSSCAVTGMARRLTGTGLTVPEGEILLVGKFIIDPPPEGYERKSSITTEGNTVYFDPGGKSALGGQFHMLLDGIMRPLKGRDRKSFVSWPDDTKIMSFEGETFFVFVKKAKLFGTAAAYFMERNGRSEFIMAPASFSLDIRKGDEAIYIGTIKYKRDMYYQWEKIEVLDEYAGAYAEFRKLFDASVRIRKAPARWLGEKFWRE